MRQLLYIVLIFSFFCCTNEEADDDLESQDSTESENAPTGNSSPNILLIIADDMGKDATNGFPEGTIKPTTPNIDAIKNTGIQFNNFWTYPTCSPTRATIITGKYGYRTGVKWANDELNQSETILQKYINDNTSNKYATAIVGKWHLSGGNTAINPESFGLDYYAGLMRGQAKNYTNWELSENGTSSTSTEYITTEFTDLAINWINQQSKPWFMWLAYNAPHTPFHVPPNGMHSQGDLPPFSDGLDETPYYMAAIEAMDFQIGRLLDSMTVDEKENTIIIFIGDNGSPNEVAQSPYDFYSVKGSLHQGGVNVPMFISGKGILRRGYDTNLVSSTDLFATISELAGVTVNEVHDSKSFKKLLTENTSTRNFQYAEKNDEVKDIWAISNGNYKLIENADGSEEFYSLNDDPYEQNDLLGGTLSSTQSDAKTALEIELLNIRK